MEEEKPNVYTGEPVSTPVSEMQMISCWIPRDWNMQRKKARLKWDQVIRQGLESRNVDVALNIMRGQIDQLQKDYQLLDADYSIRGRKIQKYFQKYGALEE